MNQYLSLGIALLPVIISGTAGYIAINKKVDRALVLIEGMKELIAHNEKHRSDIIEEFKVMFDRDLRGVTERSEHNTAQIEQLRKEFYLTERKQTETLAEIKSLITSKK